MPNISKQFLKACQYEPTKALDLLLLLSNINVNIRNCNRETPLHFAVAANHKELISTLLEKGANPNAQDDGGDTPLHKAVSFSDYEMISLLLSAGASLELKNRENKTPIDLAESYGYMALLAKAIQIRHQRLSAQKQQGLFRMEMLKQAIAEQEKLIAKHEEMIRQQELNLQRIQNKIQFANLRTFEQLQTLAPSVSSLPTPEKQKTIAAPAFFDNITSNAPAIPRASISTEASTSSQSTSQVTSSRMR